MPRAIALSLNVQPLLPSLSVVAQVPGVSARAISSVASKATPCVPASLRRPARVKATAVPCPPSSSTVVPPATSADAGEMRLPNSWLCRSMPLSTTPTVTPDPVAATL